MPKTKDGGYIIDDEPIVANSPEEWAEKMLEKAGLKPKKKPDKKPVKGDNGIQYEPTKEDEQ